MEDFDKHLDSARLWWELEDVVLAAIIEGQATGEPFRLIAGYTRSLRQSSGPSPTEAQANAAITKIAIRLAAMPEFSPIKTEDPPRVLARIARALALTVLGMLVVMGLLVAGDAADIIELPRPFRVMLDRIGIDPPGDQSRSDTSLEWSSPYAETENRAVITPVASTEPVERTPRTGGDKATKPVGHEDEKAKKVKRAKPQTKLAEAPAKPEDVAERAPKNRADFGRSQRPTARPEPTRRPGPKP